MPVRSLGRWQRLSLGPGVAVLYVLYFTAHMRHDGCHNTSDILTYSAYVILIASPSTTDQVDTIQRAAIRIFLVLPRPTQ